MVDTLGRYNASESQIQGLDILTCRLDQILSRLGRNIQLGRGQSLTKAFNSYSHTFVRHHIWIRLSKSRGFFASLRQLNAYFIFLEVHTELVMTC